MTTPMAEIAHESKIAEAVGNADPNADSYCTSVRAARNSTT
eukprot:CAMPEP_0119555096 /NCGR_PEP_ID=MMETSP1352-20130426/7413_1 /TAXON_ID=265584 /ORGANISM="Stauroneis constricta, Strain CCMP1120" /LENGTH=40 /DNA_ID= /DNA_START= /DNA_END= /DNA_ORIENTATION=